MEEILVVKTQLLRPFLRGRNALLTDCVDEIGALVAERHEFLPRPEAEKDPSYKQIIPYVTVCRGDRVFATTRLDKGGEARLHGRISLGVGGHIERRDEDEGKNALQSGLMREITEEIEIPDIGDLTLRGIINDDSNEVGSVHLGFFYTLTTSGPVAVRETEKLAGTWLHRSELWDLSERMETWSQLLLPLLCT